MLTNRIGLNTDAWHKLIREINMKTYLNIGLALIAGMIIGGIVNMAIVMLGPMIIPPPAGVDMSSAESMGANVDLLESKHYIFPLIAHALGTYVGALVAYKIAKQYQAIAAMLIGLLFFIGGVTAIQMIDAPTDFILVDLIFAYFPMAYAAIKTLQPHPALQKIDDLAEIHKLRKRD